ncbi:MAG: TRAP transporter TatT component family protein [Gammaproteobacteria bacterium]|nr:TRAP transporter TatT component family protein [Gammaproteobacteria bacterium]
MIEGGITALNHETDLQLAEAAFPPNITLMEGMVVNDPYNSVLHEHLAQAYYGFAYGFIEDTDKQRASQLYYRGLKHGFRALMSYDITSDQITGTPDALQSAINHISKDAINALFWTASCWAKWVDMNRDKVESLAQMPKAVILMQRALDIDESFFMGGPNLFFAIYYGSKPPMLGGDYTKSENYFKKARSINNNKLLLVDLLQSQYLDRQLLNKEAFHTRLLKIINSPDNIYPEQALITMIAKQKAKLFLSMEDQWF